MGRVPGVLLPQGATPAEMKAIFGILALLLSALLITISARRRVFA